jgi:hypothetical protein
MEEENEDKSKMGTSEFEVSVQCKSERSIVCWFEPIIRTIHIDPKNIDDLLSYVCPTCGGDKFDIIEKDGQMQSPPYIQIVKGKFIWNDGKK